MSEAGPSTSSSSSSVKARMDERMKKLRDLHLKRNEARQLNHAEVVEEDKRAKEPKNMEARKRKAQYLLEEEQLKQKCLAEGKDFEREKLRQLGADVADALDKRKRGKTNPDQGFSTYEEAAFRKHNQLIKQIKPEMEVYEEKKKKEGEAFYAEAGTVIHGSHTDSKDAIERLAQDVEAQVAKRGKYSRRRAHDDDADIGKFDRYLSLWIVFSFLHILSSIHKHKKLIDLNF